MARGGPGATPTAKGTPDSPKVGIIDDCEPKKDAHDVSPPLDSAAPEKSPRECMALTLLKLSSGPAAAPNAKGAKEIVQGPVDSGTALPYGGDLQAAIRAQDRAAIRRLMGSPRTQPTRGSSKATAKEERVGEVPGAAGEARSVQGILARMRQAWPRAPVCSQGGPDPGSSTAKVVFKARVQEEAQQNMVQARDSDSAQESDGDLPLSQRYGSLPQSPVALTKTNCITAHVLYNF